MEPKHKIAVVVDGGMLRAVMVSEDLMPLLAGTSVLLLDGDNAEAEGLSSEAFESLVNSKVEGMVTVF